MTIELHRWTSAAAVLLLVGLFAACPPDRVDFSAGDDDSGALDDDDGDDDDASDDDSGDDDAEDDDDSALR